eukprot:Phypoly_transcript_12342.p1 GENE.Phypoly_transcript_12342~~Phypoly_transcript_12342.p1  ORF type:complete len:342 (+),score=31.48 Phypoly_transcript_12342:104-1129(+)
MLFKEIDFPQPCVDEAAVLWGLHSVKMVKQSQNYTASAVDPLGHNVMLRLCPSIRDGDELRLRSELDYILHVSKQGELDVCEPMLSTQNKLYHIVGSSKKFLAVVFRFARGTAWTFDWTWLHSAAVVKAWGRGLAQIRRASMKIESNDAFHLQRWDTVHSNLLQRGDEILNNKEDEPDRKEFSELMKWMNDLPKNKDNYGICHGDFIISNFFKIEEHGKTRLDVFDFDQAQFGWYIYDLSIPLFSVYSLSTGVVGPLPGVDFEFFKKHLLEGYEEYFPLSAQDKEWLGKFVKVRVFFYFLFCKRAVWENENGGPVPDELAAFTRKVVEWYHKNGHNTISVL